MYDNVHSFSRKFINDLIQLIDSTRPKTSDPTDELNLISVGRPKLEFGSSHEKFHVWPSGTHPLAIGIGLLRIGMLLKSMAVSVFNTNGVGWGLCGGDSSLSEDGRSIHVLPFANFSLSLSLGHLTMRSSGSKVRN